MHVNLYVVRDVEARYAGQVLTFRHDAVATRWFADMVQDPQTSINKHPRDHELVQVGTLDDETGEVAQMPPRVVLTGGQVLDLMKESDRA